MIDKDDAQIWRGLRAHFEELTRMSPPLNFARVSRQEARRGELSVSLAPLAVTATVVVIAVFVVGPAILWPRGASRDPSLASSEALHGQAQSALDRWAQAVAQSHGVGIVIVGDITGQVGDWEASVGDNNKIAVLAGAVEAPSGLPIVVPAPGTVRWSTGRSEAVSLISASEALARLVASATSICSECQPVLVTSADLTIGSMTTSRGAASVPVWEFKVAGSAVRITRVAVDDVISGISPAWDPYNPPRGISIDSAVGDSKSTELLVAFIGAANAVGQCAATYSTEAVESDLAIVVIVNEHSTGSPDGSPSEGRGGCSAATAIRTASVTLSAPLGDRAVLEVKEGMPVAVTGR